MQRKKQGRDLNGSRGAFEVQLGEGVLEQEKLLRAKEQEGSSCDVDRPSQLMDDPMREERHVFYDSLSSVWAIDLPRETCAKAREGGPGERNLTVTCTGALHGPHFQRKQVCN